VAYIASIVYKQLHHNLLIQQTIWAITTVRRIKKDYQMCFVLYCVCVSLPFTMIMHTQQLLQVLHPA